ncbi:MAG TPA: hypothetical protein PKI02_15150 [Mycobacterium sp.]|nr:hypothetical protein [Mycobacterium sp.]
MRKLPSNRGWGIYDDNGHLHDSDDTHADAMDWAHWYSLVQDLAQPGALAAFQKMRDDADWWQAYIAACEEVKTRLEPLVFTRPGLPILPPQPGFTINDAPVCGTCWAPGEDDE